MAICSRKVTKANREALTYRLTIQQHPDLDSSKLNSWLHVMGKHSDKNAVLAHNWNHADASHHTQVSSKLQWLDQDNTSKRISQTAKIELELQNHSDLGYSETQQQYFVPFVSREGCNMLQWFLRTGNLPKNPSILVGMGSCNLETHWSYKKVYFLSMNISFKKQGWKRIQEWNGILH